MRFDLGRKMLFGAAALILPVATLGVVIGTGGTAFAKKPPPPNGPTVTCPLGAVVTFAAPGLSVNGSENTSKTDLTTTGSETVTCSVAGNPSQSGTFPAENIVSKATKCKGAGNPDPSCTVKGDYAYDSFAAFATTGTATLQKALKKLSITIGSNTFSLKTTGGSEVIGSPCASNEVGFELTGEVKAPKTPDNYKGGTSTLVACLLHDSGPDTTNNFKADITNGHFAGDIATATLDPATSSLVITSP